MRQLALLALLAALAAPAQAQLSEFKDGRLARIDDPLLIQLQADTEKLRQVISIVAPSRSWKILSDVPGRFELTRTVSGKHMMRIELAYHDRGYAIRYLDSSNLLYDGKAQTVKGNREAAIHKNYNLWIRDLASSINAATDPNAMIESGRRRARPATALPASFRVVPPGPEIPAAEAAFSGVWSGKWSGKFEHTLVVEKFEGGGVFCRFSFDTGSGARSWRRMDGSIDHDGVLRGTMATDRGPVTVSYRLSADGSKLAGERYRNGRLMTGEFERRKTP